jgi:Uri superfamily endonuclease
MRKQSAAGTESRSGGMRTEPGTYVVLFRCPSPACVQVGRRGQLVLHRGYYLYVGSAFGPGGVGARVSRHCRHDKKLRWHIDYLRDALQPLGAWYSHDARRLEHRWAACLTGMPGATPVAGFGCSDCRCESHLFHFAKQPEFAPFQALVRETVVGLRLSD